MSPNSEHHARSAWQQPDSRQRKSAATALVVCFVVLASGSLAQAPDSPRSPFIDDFLTIEKGYSSKYVDLAKAIPAEHYDWRPDDQVRSIREVLQHIVQTNQGLIQGLSGGLPEGLDHNPADIANRDELITMLEASFSAVRELVKGLAGTPASAPLQSGTGSRTLGLNVLANTQHFGEHLGQLVAYARSVGVTPPWSR